MRTNTGLWPALERLATGRALLIDWQRQLGKEFDAARTFLLPTTEKDTSYPCMDPFPCSCRHRIYETTIQQNPPWPNAACECEGGEHCEPFFVPDKDLIIWKFNAGTLALAIRGQLAAANLLSGVDADSILEMNGGQHRPSHWLVAGRRPFESSVIIASPFNADELLRTAETLASPYGDRFLLLTPTRRHYSEAFEVALKRRDCLALPLNELFRLGPSGCVEMIGGNHLSVAFEHLRQNVGLAESAKASVAAPTIEPAKAIANGGSKGRLRWDNDFREVRVGTALYNLENRKKARFCLQYLATNDAFDESSSKHLLDEINPFVRARSGMPALPESSNENLRIQQYFTGDKRLEKLCRDLIRSAGNGRFFLSVS